MKDQSAIRCSHDSISLTAAVASITVQCVSSIARAVEGVFCVRTDLVTATIIVHALVHRANSWKPQPHVDKDIHVHTLHYLIHALLSFPPNLFIFPSSLSPSLPSSLRPSLLLSLLNETDLFHQLVCYSYFQ